MESPAIVYIVYSGLFDVRGVGVVVAVIVVLAESGIFVASGARCPLTTRVRRLGDEMGNDFVADIFLPQRFARLIPLVCGGLALLGLLIIGARLFIR